MQSLTSYEDLLGRLSRWAEGRDDLRAAIVIGSRARRVNPADEYSDLDLLLVTASPPIYLESTAWLDNLAPYLLTFLEPAADGGGTERRVLFAGMFDVDFVPEHIERVYGMVQTIKDPAHLPDAVRRGARVVFDKDGVLTAAFASLQLPAVAPPAPSPTEAEFLNRVHDFWYHCVWTAKKLRRGELWTAKGCLDCYLKWNCLLPMLMWQAHAVHGPGYETWLRGRFLEQWADSRAVAGLGETCAHYDLDDSWPALFATMNLFRWLSEEVARAHGWAYPGAAADEVTAWVQAAFTSR